MAFQWCLKWVFTIVVLHALLLFVVSSSRSSGESSRKPRDLIDMLKDDFLDDNGMDENTFVEHEGPKAPLGEISERPPPRTTVVSMATTSSTTSTRTGQRQTASPASALISSTPTVSSPSASGSVALSGSASSILLSPSPIAYEQTPSASTGEAKEWKVIGLVVICITFIGTLILSIVFFDSWWGFLCAITPGCGRKGTSDEGMKEPDLVPDWEKQGLEFQLAGEDGHRYPVARGSGGVEAMGKTELDKEKTPSQARTNYEVGSGISYSDLALPHLPYLRNYDSRLAQPLVRRPSTNSEQTFFGR